MSTLTIRLPDDTAQRLKSLAQSRGLSVNKLLEEFSVQAIAAFDAESRFRAAAASGNPEQALAILDRLDGGTAAFAERCPVIFPGLDRCRISGEPAHAFLRLACLQGGNGQPDAKSGSGRPMNFLSPASSAAHAPCPVFR